MNNLSGIGAGLGTLCSLAGAAVGFVYFVGPCIGGAATKVLPLDASWDRPTGAAQTVCAAGSGFASDVFANLFKQNVQGRMAGSIPITGRGVSLPDSQRRTHNDLRGNDKGGYNGPYNSSLTPQQEAELHQFRLENPNAPADAHPGNVDGGFDWPFMNTNYTYQGQNVGGGNHPQYRQCAGASDTNCDGVISLGELSQ